ncbi:glycosyltransferase family 2 protein [Loigolactobacillus backii]|uniref:Glycosyltransferase n=1 Tax=Loigolactobacillus backii TaxID=375175 RepID=A0A192GZ65_9LACO|nr:glycosyltransferase family 2 protein [Loigolactobacillus backii]ANK58951.1 glycosyltransferase [Loigolactobacillus backii]ANK61380.1 glycosyltransferase [Loigolactobacillus backii]ANK63939.1 glycosyltransferase [Loigolactobacillus backii]ANK66387.1 glycosyltransferase [Loigolactobacillus backii]ANK69420.1 glycosyltransferase [Loigolactobacillus backii]
MIGTQTPKISIVLPVYNEEAGILATIAALEQFISNQDEAYEMIFVDDGSVDASAQLIKQARLNDDAIRLVQFSRNFGHQLAITAGIRYATGDAVVVMDADLQDPPEVIPAMIKCWRAGNQVVYGQRLGRDGETWFKKLTAKLFYRVLKRATPLDIPLDTGDFRLMDRRVVTVLAKLDEPGPFVRGLVSWVGFKQTAVTYERHERIAGQSKYPLNKMFGLAIDGLTSFSGLPLQFSVWAGAGLFLLSVVAFIHIVVSGTAGESDLLLATLLLTTSLILLSIGLVSTYLYRIFVSSRKRPLYVVAETTGFRQVQHYPNYTESSQKWG